MEFVNGLSIVGFTIGIVEWLKKMGIAGIWVNVSSILVGVALSIGSAFSNEPPITFGDWFTTVLWGIGFGLIASGIWDSIPGREEV